MHRDQKVGLALGVLLVGIVGAFFFRHDRHPSAEAPRLDDPRKLDRRIAEKSVSPYLDDAPAARRADAARGSAANDSPAAPGLPVGDFLRDRPGSASPAANPSRAPGPSGATLGPPEPIPHEPPVAGAERPPRSTPRHNDLWDGIALPNVADPRDPHRPGDRTRNASLTGNAATRTHEVRRGDTLTSLAEKYLGTSRRYLEIYEANRDLLRNPNDLREGMTLRIPDRSPAATEAPTGPPAPHREPTSQAPTEPPGTPPPQAGRAPIAVDDATVPVSRERPVPPPTDDPLARPLPGTSDAPADPQAPPVKFVPVKRSPLVPRAGLDGTQGRTDAAGVPVADGPRRISQKPPTGLPSLEDLLAEPVARRPADAAGPPPVSRTASGDRPTTRN
jgi:phage tail protein X